MEPKRGSNRIYGRARALAGARAFEESLRGRTAMGEVRVKLRLENEFDLRLHESGKLAKRKIRCVEGEAVAAGTRLGKPPGGGRRFKSCRG